MREEHQGGWREGEAMTDYTELKRLADAANAVMGDVHVDVEVTSESGPNQAEIDAVTSFLQLATPAAVMALIAENEQLKGLQLAFPPRPPDGGGLPRYGLRWNGPQQPLAVLMNDGYWTPWHLAESLKTENEALRKDADRYRWLRGQHWNESEMAVVCQPKKAVRLGFDCPSEGRLDCTIDAAMGEQS